jgi:hypothetical protein
MLFKRDSLSITVDLTSDSSRFTRMVIVPRVPMLRILLPENASNLEDITGVILDYCPCPVSKQTIIIMIYC